MRKPSAKLELVPDAAAAKAIAATTSAAESPTPSRPVIEHTKLFRASMQVAQRDAENALFVVDSELQAAAEGHEARMELERQRYAEVRRQLDEQRQDVVTHKAGIDAALAATAPRSVAGELAAE